MIKSATIYQFGPIGLIEEGNYEIPGYSCVMTVHGMTPAPPAPIQAAEVPDVRPIFVVAYHHGQYLDYLKRSGLSHRNVTRVTRYQQLCGLSTARIVLLPNYDRLIDGVEIQEALLALSLLPDVSIIAG